MLAAVFSALSVGSAARLIALRGATEDVIRSRMGSLKTWWVLALLLAVAMVLEPWGIIALFFVASCFGLNEYRRFVDAGTDRIAVAIAFGATLVSYLLIGFGQTAAFTIFIPLGGLGALAAWRSVSGRCEGYIRSTGGLQFGLMVIVYGLSHAALLFTMPESWNPVLGNVGWFLLLVTLTETNDISQALIGRRIGRHKITPRVSPNKTWEGFLGGLLVTTLLAVTLAPFLTPLCNAGLLETAGARWRVPWVWALAIGPVIAFTGFLGDINMSAIKRDVGVKDGSSLLPGQGGAIDRIDSLTFAAPAYYYLLQLLFS